MLRVLLILTVLSAAVAAEPPQVPGAAALSFYIVSDVKMEGGRFIDTADLPKVGYIGAKPDLAVTELVGVSRTPPVSHISVDANGKTSESGAQRALMLELRDDDAKKFAALTERVAGSRLLLMLGDQPLMAPVVRARIETKRIQITLAANADDARLEGALRRLVPAKSD